MREKELRRSMSVLPIGTVMKLTDLTARQIRYYEQQELIKPLRNEGNRRMYSLNDVDRLLEIKDYLDDGLNISGIKEVYKKQNQLEDERKRNLEKGLTDSDVRKILQDEFLNIGGLKPPSSSFDNPNNLNNLNKLNH
ncbi:MerR family transcriptional regulator [Lentilactobacillus otakiensis]|uniref:MerR family transcriptional regulator n=1 Tax=Lentilactobacillus otakiensis TaxID=481720 RepID=UPI003D17CAC4